MVASNLIHVRIPGPLGPPSLDWSEIGVVRPSLSTVHFTLSCPRRLVSHGRIPDISLLKEEDEAIQRTD
jgi:hypothetical protein